MGLESATFISQLVATNPVGAADPKSQGDDHLRLIKGTLLASFANISGAVTTNHNELNLLAGTPNRTGYSVGASNLVFSVSPTFTGTVLAANITVSGNLLKGVNAVPSVVDNITWTGANIFTGASTRGGGAASRMALGLVAGVPLLSWNWGGGGVNARAWEAVVDASGWRLQTVDDAFTVGKPAFSATRGAGNIVAAIELSNATDNAPVTVLGTGNTTVAALVVNCPNVASSGIIINGVAAGQSIVQLASNAGAAVYLGATGAAGHIATDASAAGELIFRTAFQDLRLTINAGASTSFLLKGSGGAPGGLVGAGATGGSMGNGTINVPASYINGVSVRDVPKRAGTFAQGECSSIAAGITLNTADMAAGRCFSVYNDSAANITITQGAGVTLRLSGTTTTGNRTLLARGLCMIWCNSGTEAVISGSVI